MNCASQSHSPPPLLPAGSSGLPKSTIPAHLWNTVAFMSPLHVVTCWAVTSPMLGPSVSSCTWGNLECYTLHPDSALCHHGPRFHRPWVKSLCSTTLPHHGYIGGSIGSSGMVSRSLVKFRGIQFTSIMSVNALFILGGGPSPVGERRDRVDMRSGYYSPFFIVPKKSSEL